METIKNILTAILKWLGSIPSDKLLHLIAGAVIAAFFALVIPYTAEICVLFAAIAGVAKEAFDQYRYKDGIGLTWPIQWPEVSSFKFSRGYETTFETHRIEATYTIGWLYIDGQKVCDTIEDAVRDLNKNGRFDNGEKKVYAATAIPYGTYDITLKVQSPKYKDRAQYKFCDGYLPRLLNVPEFDGILIHIGNTAEDSAGCILVGENKEVGKVLNSTATFRRVYDMLKTASDRGEPIQIEIV